MSSQGGEDIFRDSWVRYLGYSNEVGESFRPVLPVKVVRASYGVAFAYVLADTADKSWKMVQKDGRPKNVLIETGDALIWQTLASIVIPGFTINRLCAYSQKALCRYNKIPVGARNIITVCIGLASIPIIVRPIDKGVSLLMDATYRKWVK
ncbi:mitochondrial fission process protein 1 [Galleria mellonella]|uniref:Mitochondrial fission process protein 1 n=1 Tax=Galleria mellonella TaxID=7137 RepID=A0A6J1WJY0_GALME|nr:mitochondrial fission process protein 1 [Galleria mellonella]